jgi:ParB-like chromosome segregation protein Spo0J
MQIRDRIRSLRRVPASSLRPHPQNWRTHPPAQQAAIRGALAEIGYASALLARELPDGSLQLIDGHLRAETTPDALVPVLVLDLDEDEAAKLLATFDPLAALASTDVTALQELLGQIDCHDPALQAMLADLAPKEAASVSGRRSSAAVEVPEMFQVVVECRDEGEQRVVYDRLSSEGFRCRLLSL